jgi:signal transduction histidine kinase
MIKNLSLRMKLTLITTTIICLVSVVLTLVSMNNANSNIISPFNALSTTAAEEVNIMKKEEVDNSYDFDRAYIDQGTLNSSNMTSSTIATVITSAESAFNYNAIIYMILAIAIGGGFTYFIIGEMLHPVKELSNKIESINENQLSHRISGFDSSDELNKLANSFNIMIDRIDKAFESQKRFSAYASHELKTPLTVLKTNLDVLSIDSTPTVEDYAYTVDIFKKQTERMISLVENLFIISAQKEYDFNDTIDLDNMFSEILVDLESEINKKNLVVEINKSSLNLKGNKVMITHALANIVQNAVKYNNKDGNIVINIEEKDYIIITIKDTGIGIPEDKALYIFEAFYRVDSSRSRKIAGAGLGLAISYNVIKNHGGNISFKSNQQDGSIFKVTLPKLN